MKQFLNVIKVLLVYNPNYSSFFPPGSYLKNVVFDLIFKWDLKIYQMEVMSKWLEVENVVETVLETRPRDNVTPRRGGDVPQRRYWVFYLGVTEDVVETY